MHAGVLRDMEQQKIKRERAADFERSRILEDEYRKIQHVSENNSRTVSSTGWVATLFGLINQASPNEVIRLRFYSYISKSLPITAGNETMARGHLFIKVDLWDSFG